VNSSFVTAEANAMKRITRNRRLTPEEAAKYRKVPQQIDEPRFPRGRNQLAIPCQNPAYL
jgi:hypothetical protein